MTSEAMPSIGIESRDVLQKSRQLNGAMPAGHLALTNCTDHFIPAEV